MDDYWLDAARPRRRPWELEQDPDNQNPYPPIGLEAFRPEGPPAIGFNVQPPQPEPYEEFARAWGKAAEPPSDAPHEELLPYEPSRRWFDSTEHDRRSWWNEGQPSPSWSFDPTESVDQRSADPPAQQSARPQVAVASVEGLLRKAIGDAALLAGPIVVDAGKKIASGVDSALQAVGHRGTEIAALLNPMHAPRLLTDRADWGARTTDLGNGYRFVEGRDGTATIRESDGGVLGTGIAESTRNLPVDARVIVRPDGTRDYAVDWDGLQSLIKYDKTLEAMQKWSAAMARPTKEKDASPPSPGPTGEVSKEGSRTGHEAARGVSSNTPPPDNQPGPPDPWDHLARKIAEEFPHLARRSLDHWSADNVEPNEAELAHEKSCRVIQRLRGEPAPDSQFHGENGIETPFGTVAPTVGRPQAETAPEYPRHFNGILGETEMAMRFQNAMPNSHILVYGNAPGVNGPDGIAVSDGFDSPMILESKYSTSPKSVSPSQAALTPSKPELVQDRFATAKQSGRIPEEIIEKAADSYLAGNYSTCTVGTGEAYNGYVVHHRNGRAVMVKRIRK